jgi:hypothetical protein
MPTNDCPASRIWLRGSPGEASDPGSPRRVHRVQHEKAIVAMVAVLAAVVSGHSESLAASDDAEFHTNLRYLVDSPLRGCWDEAEFRKSVVRRVGYDPFREGSAISVTVRVGGSAKAVGGQVEWANASGTRMGERRFVAKDANCARLLGEMSFAVSLQIELLRPAASQGSGAPASAPATSTSDAPPPLPATTATPPSSVSQESSPPPSAPAPPTEAPKEGNLPESEKDRQPSEDTTSSPEPEEPREQPRWAMWIGLGPSLAWGISPSLTGSGRLFLGIRRNDLSLELGAESTYPSSDQRWGGSGFREMIIGANAGLCGHHRGLAACLLGKASQIRANGLGLDQPASPTGLVTQAGLRVGATVELSESWAASLHLDALGLLARCRVFLNDVQVWEMPRLSASAGIDLSLRFW